MPTRAHNKQSQLYSMRVPLSLADRINAYAAAHDLSRNQAFIELLTRGLDSDMLRDTLENTPSNTLGDTPRMMAELMERLVALETRLALGGKPQQDMRRVARLDESKHYLGPLCERNHDWQGTRQSRRAKRNDGCLECEAETARARRSRSKVKAVAQG